jgi:hypothetical protein
MHKVLEDRVRRALGDGLPEAAVQEALVLVYDDLTLAVGMWITDQLSLAEIEEYERVLARDGDNGAHLWLHDRLPGLCQVIERETVALLGRLAQIHA